MLWILGAVLAALGVAVFLGQRSLASWLIGGHLIFLSLTSFFVHTGLVRGEKLETALGAFYIVILGAIYSSVLLGLMVRQFFLSRNVRVDRMEEE